MNKRIAKKDIVTIGNYRIYYGFEGRDEYGISLVGGCFRNCNPVPGAMSAGSTLEQAERVVGALMASEREGKTVDDVDFHNATTFHGLMRLTRGLA